MKKTMVLLLLSLAFVFFGCHSSPAEDAETVSVEIKAPNKGTLDVLDSGNAVVVTIAKGKTQSLSLTKDATYSLRYTNADTSAYYVTGWVNATRSGVNTALFSATEGLSIKASNVKIAKEVKVKNTTGSALTVLVRGPGDSDAATYSYTKTIIAASDTTEKSFLAWVWDSSSYYQAALYLAASDNPEKKLTVTKTGADADGKLFTLGVSTDMASTGWNTVTATDNTVFQTTQSKENATGNWTQGASYVALDDTSELLTVSLSACDKSITVTNNDETSDNREITMEQAVASPNRTYCDDTLLRVIMKKTHAKGASIKLGLIDAATDIAYTNAYGGTKPATATWDNTSETAISQQIAYADITGDLTIVTTSEGSLSNSLEITAPAYAAIKATKADNSTVTVTAGSKQTLTFDSQETVSLLLQDFTSTDTQALYKWGDDAVGSSMTEASVVVSGEQKASAVFAPYKNVSVTAPANVTITVSDFLGPQSDYTKIDTKESVEVAGGVTTAIKMWTYETTGDGPQENTAKVSVKNWATTYTTDANLTGKYLYSKNINVYVDAKNADKADTESKDHYDGMYNYLYVPLAATTSNDLTLTMDPAKSVSVTPATGFQVMAYQYAQPTTYITAKTYITAFSSTAGGTAKVFYFRPDLYDNINVTNEANTNFVLVFTDGAGSPLTKAVSGKTYSWSYSETTKSGFKITFKIDGSTLPTTAITCEIQ